MHLHGCTAPASSHLSFACSHQAAFVADDVSNIIKESIDAVLQNQQYSELKARQPHAPGIPMHAHTHMHAQHPWLRRYPHAACQPQQKAVLQLPGAYSPHPVLSGL